MAAVRIIRDPLASDRGADVPRSQWGTLLEERQRFCTQHLPKDCRNLIFFVDDGAENDWFGYGSSDAYIRDALGLDPALVDWAVTGLRKLQPHKPVPLSAAVRLGKRGRPRKGEEKGVLHTLMRGTGNAAYTLARLARDHPDILAAYERGEFKSARAAAKAAGILKEKSAFDRIISLLDDLSIDEVRALRSNLDSYLWFREHEHEASDA